VSQPKIAIFDIETAPSLGYFWGKLYETDIIEVDTPWYMLCFSYKWLGEKRIYTHSLRDYPGYQRDMENDKKLVESLHRLFDSADILIAHNGDRFDIRKSNAKFLKYDLKPPSHYRTVDTLKIARKHFGFDSSRLNALGQYLGVGGKKPTTGFDLWKRCMGGEDAAWKEMENYNRRDIELLEQIYLKLRPYAATHPNMALYAGSPGKYAKTSGHPPCQRCQSIRTKKNGTWLVNAGRYQQMRCQDCGFTFKGGRLGGGYKATAA